MTISNAKFDRIAARRDRLEKKSERLESRIDTLEERLEDLDPVDDYNKIERIQNRIDKFNDRLFCFEFFLNHPSIFPLFEANLFDIISQ